MENKTFIFILQKQANGIGHAHFENVKSFSSNIKALKYCRKELNLEPLNVKTKADMEKFINSNEQLFGMKEKMGSLIGKVTERYKIVKLEME